MELIFHVGRISGHREREFLRRLFPLLGRLILHTLLEVHVAFLGECAQRNQQQAGRQKKRNEDARLDCGFHKQISRRSQGQAGHDAVGSGLGASIRGPGSLTRDLELGVPSWCPMKLNSVV